jgi:hypothetical protein
LNNTLIDFIGDKGYVINHVKHTELNTLNTRMINSKCDMNIKICEITAYIIHKLYGNKI